MFWKLTAATRPWLFSGGRQLTVGGRSNYLPSVLPLACSLRGFSAGSRPAPPTPDGPSLDNSNPATTDTASPDHDQPPPSSGPFFCQKGIPIPPGYRPPWHRAYCHDPDPYRRRSKIVGGIFIPYSEGKAWLKKTHGIDLPDNHSKDLAILIHLMRGMMDRGYLDNLELVQGRDTDDAALDILVITKARLGKFRNKGPEGIEEVVQKDLKNIFKPGRSEKKWIEMLFQEFGRRMESWILCIQ